MLAPLLLASVLAAGPLKVRVEVVEYAVGMKPVPGARVTLREENGSAELKAMTDAKGRAWFDVQHLGWVPVEVEKEGYVTRAEMKPFQKELGKTESKEPRGGEELFWRVTLYPRSYWAGKYRMLTKEQSLAAAQEWGRSARSTTSPASPGR